MWSCEMERIVFVMRGKRAAGRRISEAIREFPAAATTFRRKRRPTEFSIAPQSKTSVVPSRPRGARVNNRNWHGCELWLGAHSCIKVEAAPLQSRLAMRSLTGQSGMRESVAQFERDGGMWMIKRLALLT